MYTTTGEKLTWSQFNVRVAKGEKIFVGNYPKSDKEAFKRYAYNHTKAETLKWLDTNDFSLDIMYTNGRPDCYDRWNGECAGIHCKDGWIWNLVMRKQKIFETSEGVSLNVMVGEDRIIGLSSTNPAKVMEALNKDLKSSDVLAREFASIHLQQISALGGIHKETSC